MTIRNLMLSLAAVALLAGAARSAEEPASALDFTVRTLEGREVDLKQYEGKVLLIVNVASRCGLTPQYEQLQELHDRYAERGLAILAFPCNQFGGQEPGTAEQIREFCERNYGVEFDLFEKIDVNGDDAAPLYAWLTDLDVPPAGSGDIRWNFEKFLVGRDGQVVARFAPRTRPDAREVIAALEAELQKPAAP